MGHKRRARRRSHIHVLFRIMQGARTSSQVLDAWIRWEAWLDRRRPGGRIVLFSTPIEDLLPDWDKFVPAPDPPGMKRGSAMRANEAWLEQSGLNNPITEEDDNAEDSYTS